ncbi:MAG TPA: DUF6290 family protein [Telluria sp.]|nr:DUF6290 family protein [Telluria sp.]
MSTTTIRLPDELKERVAQAAERAGTTPHNFILQAIAEKAETDEKRNEFLDEAERRYADIVANGKTISWNEMRSYLAPSIGGKPAKRPTAKKFTR